MSTPCGGPESLSPFIDLVPPTLTSGWRPCVCIACVCWFEVVLASAGCVCVLLCDKAIQMNVGFWSAVCVCAERVVHTEIQTTKTKKRKWLSGSCYSATIPAPRATTGRDEILSLPIEDVDIITSSSSSVYYTVRAWGPKASIKRERNMWMNHHHLSRRAAEECQLSCSTISTAKFIVLSWTWPATVTP